jgi:hypothetical protein
MGQEPVSEQGLTTMPDNADEIMVVIAHPWGNISIPLSEWIEHGPGLRRFAAPRAAFTKAGQRLPLSVIPLRYRNSMLSRLLIRIGWLENPWQNKAHEIPPSSLPNPGEDRSSLR